MLGLPLGLLSGSSHLSILLLICSLSLPPHYMSKPSQSDLISADLKLLCPPYSTPHHCVTALIHVFFMYVISIDLTYFSAFSDFFIQLHSSCLSTPACTPDLQTHDAALSSSSMQILHSYYFSTL